MAQTFEQIEVTVKTNKFDLGRIAGAIGLKLVQEQERIKGATLREVRLIFERPVKGETDG